jgi:hypothetical protein
MSGLTSDHRRTVVRADATSNCDCLAGQRRHAAASRGVRISICAVTAASRAFGYVFFVVTDSRMWHARRRVGSQSVLFFMSVFSVDRINFEIADSHQKGIKEDVDLNCFKRKPKGFHVLIRF